MRSAQDDRFATPFFEGRHRALAKGFEAWWADQSAIPHEDLDGACRQHVERLGAGGWLDEAVPEGRAHEVRAICILRECLGRHDPLADFAFVMQGLGSAALVLEGSPQQKAMLTAARQGKALAAFALTESVSGSDVASVATKAERTPGGWRLDGEKTWISNGGIADFYVIFARTGEAPGARGLSAFLVPGDAPGLSVAQRMEAMGPHPLAQLRMEGLALPEDALIGQAGKGFHLAMRVLDIFRPSVGAAALGFARRAFEETVQRVRETHRFGAPLSELQLVRARLADMRADLESAALLVHKAAWSADADGGDRTIAAALAKLGATEAASRVIDQAVQLHGGEGVRVGTVVEALYREVRALRIYEGASDVQRMIIAREVLKAADAEEVDS